MPKSFAKSPALLVTAALMSISVSIDLSANGSSITGAQSRTAGTTTPELSTLQPVAEQSLWPRLWSGFEFSEIANKRVETQVDSLKGGLTSLHNNLVEAGPYLYYILENLEKAEMPADLALLPLIESAFNPVAHSSQSAMGIWQFIPSTANFYGLSTDQGNDQRKDVVASTDAALRYLRDLHEMFDGDWLLALAAYNAGPTTIRKAMRRAAAKNYQPNYWNLKLPKETMRYVPKLIAATKLIRTPDKYGLSLPIMANRKQIETVSIGRRISIRQVADWVDLPYKILADLNPNFDQGITPTNGPHNVLVPVEVAALLRQHLRKLKGKPHSAEQFLASQFRYNASSTSNKKPLASPEASAENTSYKLYEVKAGDSLWKIAEALDTNVKTLQQWNDMKEEDKSIRIGEVLRVARITSDDAHLIKYLVRPTDTLAGLAEKFALSADEIIRWNTLLQQKGEVFAGQTLHIPTNTY